MNAFLSIQPLLKSQDVTGRYVHVETISSLLTTFGAVQIGESVDKRPIHAINMGNGPIKILMWSQMHGNESTATKGLFDALSYLAQQPSLLKPFTLKIIPMLNPDGAAAYTRVNANDIDLNRDALNQTQPESRLLVETFHAFKPHYCFNLHDQRTIFGVNNSPCMLSFLAPAADKDKTITPARESAMGVIGYIQKALQPHIPNQVGRYDDSFNPNCMGDFFTSKGTPTLLFEAGQVGQDYARVDTRKWFAFSVIEALKCIAGDLQMPNSYANIPEVEKSFVDVLILNLGHEGKVIDVALQYVEVLKDEQIHFVPIVHKMGKLDSLQGHKKLDVSTQKFTYLNKISEGSNAVWLADLLNLTQYSH
ncbi:MAG: M14 family zinc carboxypeptidase [Flavobacteriaceae bacterium]